MTAPPELTMLTVPAQVDGEAVIVKLSELPDLDPASASPVSPVPEQMQEITTLLPLKPGLLAYGCTSWVVSILVTDPVPFPLDTFTVIKLVSLFPRLIPTDPDQQEGVAVIKTCSVEEV